MQAKPGSRFQSAIKAALSEDPDQLVKRALKLDALDRRLRQSLPEPLASRVRLGNLREDKLVFLVDNPAWIRQVQSHARQLLGEAHRLGLPARDVVVKVATMRPVSPDAAPPKPLSAATRKTLRAAAAAIEDDELRSQLLQLASLP